ncbi:MAG TPA: hypothetical protein VFA52_00495 [Candidatus Paceibacterota bacterium]|nr:hypothetical protein [Candidatus Paceibacterota bacterium]
MKEGRSGFMSMAIGLVLILIGFSLWEYVAFTLQSKTPSLTASSTSSTTSNQIQIAGWKTYQDNQAGFSIQYPPDFSLTEEPGQSVSLVAPIKNYFHTVLANEASLTIFDASSTCPKLEEETYSSPTKSTVSSPAGTFSRSSWAGVGAGQLYDSVHYTLIKNNTCYSMLLLIHSTNGAGFYYSDPDQIAEVDAQEAKDKSAFMQIMDRVVSTFSFTK